MPKGTVRLECKLCERPIAVCGTLSARGKCASCSHSRIADNHIGMITRSGPYWKLWRSRMAASVGGVLLDDDHGQA